MSQDEFTKLYRYMSERFDTIDAKLDTKADKTDIDRIYAALDGMSKRQADYEVEMLASNAQLNRHEGWIQQLGAKTATKLAR